MVQKRSKLFEGASKTPETSSINLSNELSEDLPAPIHEANSSNECSGQEDDNYKCILSGDEISAIYSVWISDMELVYLQKTVMIVYDNYMKRFNLTKTGAAKEGGSAIWNQCKDCEEVEKGFINSGGDFTENGRGRHDRYHIMMDEDYREMTLEWVCNHASEKGSPNMIALDFC